MVTLKKALGLTNCTPKVEFSTYKGAVHTAGVYLFSGY
ncbi:Hypothetical protein PAU_01172 [Photorhabdus asymbiotica]|uniref:Uncharacterized protein n=1 Tax=Photorhabdus asymbiotica subsp. asymbiotica (strain ATCC 43949 / 3105-77) TaxID=553480 RepID=B6VKH1_PHOAA|nr:Hypothetical protein PAU_01172 [Photorhabdus asymbiotica]CAR66651.1 Hypothetical protein PA-RVA2-4313 [Photorhabdus asymbiotica subsp. asymbiotica ATCC 43949]